MVNHVLLSPPPTHHTVHTSGIDWKLVFPYHESGWRSGHCSAAAGPQRNASGWPGSQSLQMASYLEGSEGAKWSRDVDYQVKSDVDRNVM